MRRINFIHSILVQIIPVELRKVATGCQYGTLKWMLKHAFCVNYLWDYKLYKKKGILTKMPPNPNNSEPFFHRKVVLKKYHLYCCCFSLCFFLSHKLLIVPTIFWSTNFWSHFYSILQDIGWCNIKINSLKFFYIISL